MRYALLGFPRSGTSWFAGCLNTLPGCAIDHEPFYQPVDPMLTRSWRETLQQYQEDRLDPDPPPELLSKLSEMVTDWLVRLAPEKAGFKEVYAGWKIHAMIVGVRQADADARCIMVWRRFMGVLSSFDRHDIYWWATGVWDRLCERAAGDEGRLIDAVNAEDEPSRLYAAWLVRNYADWQAVEELGGCIVDYKSLAARDLPTWNRVKAYLGVSRARVGRRALSVLRWPHGEERRYEGVCRDVTSTVQRFQGWVAELNRRALSVADDVARPDVVRMLLNDGGA